MTALMRIHASNCATYNLNNSAIKIYAFPTEKIIDRLWFKTINWNILNTKNIICILEDCRTSHYCRLCFQYREIENLQFNTNLRNILSFIVCFPNFSSWIVSLYMFEQVSGCINFKLSICVIYHFKTIHCRQKTYKRTMFFNKHVCWVLRIRENMLR